jgi:CheY-like chemotaxis protein
MTRDRHARMSARRFNDVVPLVRGQDVDAPPSVFQLVETMMSLEPQRRYQTPSQLLEAVRRVRQEVEGGASGTSGPLSVFVIEADERLQEAIRNKFKDLGYRVFMAIDPVRALERFRQQPYAGLVVDVGTAGEEGLVYFDRIMAEADRGGAHLGGIVILSEEQADWQLRMKKRPNAVALVRPVTLKQLHSKLRELMGAGPG